MTRKRILLKVKFTPLKGKGFGAFVATTAKAGAADIRVDCDALAWAAVVHKGLKFKRIFIETLGHEFMHACEELFGVMFDERRVESAIRSARRRQKK